MAVVVWNYTEAFITVRKRSCGKVMFLHLSVSHSVHGGGSASVHAGIHPPGQTPPPGRHRPGQTHQPPGRWADTPLPSTCWDTPPCPVHAGIDMATTADGTHPNGMHSCYLIKVTSPETKRVHPLSF